MGIYGNNILPIEIIKLNNLLNSYDYGCILDGKLVNMNNFNYYNDYKSLSIEEFEKYKTGICLDFTHYEAWWFSKNNFKYDTYILKIRTKNGHDIFHAFLIFYLNNKIYYFESCWDEYKGIEIFNNLSECFETIKSRYIESNEYPKDEKILSLIFKKYDAASRNLEHISIRQYLYNISNGKINYLNEASVVSYHILDLKANENNDVTLDGKIVDINDYDDYCPIKLSNIPNYMGINLSSVKSVEWSELSDEQLIDIIIKFIPEN